MLSLLLYDRNVFECVLNLQLGKLFGLEIILLLLWLGRLIGWTLSRSRVIKLLKMSSRSRKTSIDRISAVTS